MVEWGVFFSGGGGYRRINLKAYLGYLANTRRSGYATTSTMAVPLDADAMTRTKEATAYLNLYHSAWTVAARSWAPGGSYLPKIV